MLFRSALSSCAFGLAEELLPTDIELETSSVEDYVRTVDSDLERTATVRIIAAEVRRTVYTSAVFVSQDLQKVHIEMHSQTIIVPEL